MGQENALILSPAGDKVRIRQQIEDLKQEIQGFEVELATLQPQQPIPPASSSSSPENPFVPTTGKITKIQEFFDRQKELKKVFEILNSGSSVAIIGPRQVGKSSLLRAIEHHAKTQLMPSRRAVYLNLQGVENDQDFYEALCGEIGIAVCQGYALDRSLKQLNPKVLLLLDEVEKMTWDGFTQQIRSQLRSLAEGGDAPLRLVVSASVPLDQLFPDSVGNVSPFQGLCLQETLSPWDATLVQQLITERLADRPIQFTPAEIDDIFRKTAGHPQKVMEACFRLYNNYRDRSLGVHPT